MCGELFTLCRYLKAESKTDGSSLAMLRFALKLADLTIGAGRLGFPESILCCLCVFGFSKMASLPYSETETLFRFVLGCPWMFGGCLFLKLHLLRVLGSAAF